MRRRGKEKADDGEKRDLRVGWFSPNASSRLEESDIGALGGKGQGKKDERVQGGGGAEESWGGLFVEGKSRWADSTGKRKVSAVRGMWTQYPAKPTDLSMR